jgi:hypothetical protein
MLFIEFVGDVVRTDFKYLPRVLDKSGLMLLNDGNTSTAFNSAGSYDSFNTPLYIENGFDSKVQVVVHRKKIK